MLEKVWDLQRTIRSQMWPQYMERESESSKRGGERGNLDNEMKTEFIGLGDHCRLRMLI